MKKLVLAALMIGAPAMAEKAIVTKVEVAGTRYTVRYKPIEGTAKVYYLKITKLLNAKRYMEMAEAAEKATGCKAAHTFPRDVVLNVALECPENAPHSIETPSAL